MLDRTRGFIGGGIGSISDGSSNIYSGANIPAFYWDEFGGAPQYVLTITGASNSGWTQVVLNGTTTLLRASASFASSTWTWSGAPPLGSQAFGSSGSTVNAVFT